MSDLIRRDDVLEVMCKYQWFWRKPREQIEVIKAIPTVYPKVGKRKIEEMTNIWGKGYRLTCLECGDVLTVTEDALPYERYCRCCGVLTERSE